MSAPTAVQWQAWEAATFAQAKREKRILLVNVAAAWCHWCHVMDERTFSDPRVARVLADSFTCIRVDADARPDLAERYAEWGWPANAILTPDAKPVLELRGFQAPTAFLDLITNLARDQAKGKLKGRRDPPKSKPSKDPLAKLRDRVQKRLDGYYDERLGGWGRFQKYPFAAPVEQALLRAQRGEAPWLDRAIQTLDGTRQLLDPVWGGVFQYSVNDRWDDPHFEKIAVIQAGALDNFAHAYQVTGHKRFLAAARAVESYLLNFLCDSSGAFWTSQDADVQDGPTPTAGTEYYKLSDRARRKRGQPRTDRNVYADWNGLLISSLVRLHAATGDAKPLAAARQAAKVLLQTHRNPDGAFRHADDDRSGLLHLRDNATMGRALLALHQATGEDGFLDAARHVANTILALESPDGGFYAHSADPAATGAFAERRRPLEENGLAMRFLLELDWLDGDARVRPAVERAARALALPELIKAEGRILGQFLLGLDWLVAEPLKAVVVAASSDSAAVKLRQACLTLPATPLLVTHQLPGQEYPDLGHAAVYLCKGTACSSPVRKPGDLAAAAARLG